MSIFKQYSVPRHHRHPISSRLSLDALKKREEGELGGAVAQRIFRSKPTRRCRRGEKNLQHLSSILRKSQQLSTHLMCTQCNKYGRGAQPVWTRCRSRDSSKSPGKKKAGGSVASPNSRGGAQGAGEGAQLPRVTAP